MKQKFLVGVLAIALAACSSGGSGSEGPLDGGAGGLDLGCQSCHAGADTDLAPTWNGIWGSQVELEDGTTVTVDEEYLRLAIEEPQAQIVAGYGGTMPALPMSDEERAALIEYIKSLG